MLASATPALAIPCLAVAGFALSNALPLVFSAAGRLGGSDTAGSSMAAVTTIGYCGLLCGPPVIGFVAQAASLPFAMSLAVVLAAGVALLFPARMIDG
jgi:hypothetical protein